MANPESDTDTAPTPGPWETDVPPKRSLPPLVIGKHDGDFEVVATVKRPGGGIFRGDWRENAKLIAAVGTAAQRLREMGYDDPVAVIRAVPELLRAAEGRGNAGGEDLLSRALAKAEGRA